MRKKFTMLLASLFLVMGTSVAQVYQKVLHKEWTVTAFNQAGEVGNEGGVAFIQDENPQTFYHSNYSGSQPGKDGLQGFMVDMGSVVSDITKITYTGRSDDNTSGWARKVRIYLYEVLPDGVPDDLSTVAHADKNTLFARGNAALGTAAFDNNETGEWADNRNLKTAEFTEAKSARYVLFIMDSGHDSWLTCADFNVWQKVEGIVEDKPYFLKINGLDGDFYLDTRVGQASDYGNTISKTETPVATYFTLTDGYWHISSYPGNEKHFVNVTKWDAKVGQDTPANWYLYKDKEHSLWSLAQSAYNGGGNVANHYLGANSGDISGQTKLYTDKSLAQAVKFELVELDEKQTAAEAARVALSHTGVGYPAAGSEARVTLQAAVDAAEATAESINAAIEAYKTNAQVQMPKVGKVYRLISALPFATKKAIYSDNVEARWNNRDAAAMNQLWAVQRVANGKIVLMNINDALYAQKKDANTLKMLPIEKEESLTFLGDGQFNIGNMHAQYHDSGRGSNGPMVIWDGGLNSASAWRFEEVSVSEETLTTLVNAIENTLVNSPLIEQEGLEEAVETARANSDHAAALADLMVAVDEADAQYIDLGYFYMKSKSGQKYAYNDGEDLKAKVDKVKQSIFKLTKADATTFYIQSGNGLYAQISSQSEQTKTAANQVKFTISKKTDGYYVLRAAGTDAEMAFWHQDGSNNIVGWRTSASDNSHWTLEELTVEETNKIYSLAALNTPAGSTVTYNNEAYDGDKEVKQVGGFYVLDNAPTSEDFTVKNIGEGMTSKVVVDGNSISVNVGYDGKNIYTLRCKYGDSYARYHSGCQLSAGDATNMLTYEGSTYFESLFFIEEGSGDYKGYYTIRSVAAPTMYAYNLNTANEDSKVAMMEAPAEGDLASAYYWKISSFGKETPANITPWGEGGDAYGWNKRGSYDNKNHIGYWQGGNGTDDNKWYVRLVEEEFVPSLHSVVGYPTKESFEKYSPYAQYINEAGFNKLKDANYDIILPEEGKYYRFSYDFGDAGVKYVQAEASNVTDKANAMVMTADKDEASIFYYADGKLQSYSTGQYVDENNRGLQNQGGDASFEVGSSIGLLKIKVPNYFHANELNGVYFVDHCSNDAGHAQHNFTVEEVDMSFVREYFNKLVLDAQGYANAMFHGRYTSTLYDDYNVLGDRIDVLRKVNENTTIAELKDKIQELEEIIASFNSIKPGAGFYYFVNYDNDAIWGEYLSDDIKADKETQRVLTDADNISAKNIFYYDGESLIGYASGFGFEYGICNTKNPVGRNYFSFVDAYEIDRFFVKSDKGTINNPYFQVGYWKNKKGELDRVENITEASSWNILSVVALPVTIGKLLHATFYAPVAVKIPSGVTAYTGEVKNADWFTLTEVEEEIIPAGTPVVLIAEKADTYYFKIVESAEVAITSPHLKGTAPTIPNNKEKNYYTLQSHDFDSDDVKEGIAFKQYTGDNLNGFRAYLELPEGTNATALRIRFANEGGTTGVEETIDNSQQSTVIYDLTGRRIEKVVEKGIYIVNGKKVVIK